MKKLVSMLLALCLVLGVTAASAAVPRGRNQGGLHLHR